MTEPEATTGDASSAAEVNALLVGDWQGREFAEAGEILLAGGSTAGATSSKDWPRLANIDAACELLAQSKTPPELIFLAQPFPGQYEQAEVNRLLQLAPLARVVLVVGTWAEGELRTGTPPGGAIRLYWYELKTWWQAASRRQAAGLTPLWSVPLDQHHAGRWATDSEVALPVEKKLWVAIAAADYGVYETLAAVLAEHDIASAWRGREEASSCSPTVETAAGAGIWDGGQLSERELAQLTNFCQQTEGPVVALLDFPRVEHFEQTRTAGATAVLAKPYVIEELVAALVE